VRISVNPDDPTSVHERVAGLGRILTITLDGVEQRHVHTVDDERGFVDVYNRTMLRDGGDGRGYQLIHRLFGKVVLHWSQRT
jgi:hypothetical protein